MAFVHHVPDPLTEFFIPPSIPTPSTQQEIALASRLSRIWRSWPEFEDPLADAGRPVLREYDESDDYEDPG